MYFRQQNREIEQKFRDIKALAKADGQAGLIDDEDMLLQFFCECSDANCRKRIPLKRSQYDAVHKADDTFVILCGHEVPGLEQVIEQNGHYCVVRKKVQLPARSGTLNPTPRINS